MNNSISTLSTSSFSLLRFFSQYYHKVGEIKTIMNSKNRAQALAKLTQYSGRISESDQASIIAEYLKRILLEQQQEVHKHALLAEIDVYQKCLYAMAALTDEIFLLELKWKGQNDWLGNGLEHQLFASTSAGRDLFKEIDNLLVTKSTSKLTRELASVYLLTLRLGFKGIHRDDKSETLLEYRSKLYRLVGNNDLFNRDAKLFGAAYDFLLNPVKQSRLPPLSRWRWGASFVLLAYLGASYLVWRFAVNPLYVITSGNSLG